MALFKGHRAVAQLLARGATVELPFVDLLAEVVSGHRRRRRHGGGTDAEYTEVVRRLLDAGAVVRLDEWRDRLADIVDSGGTPELRERFGRR